MAGWLSSLERRAHVMGHAAGVRLAALVTLASGLVNLYSVIGPGLPERIAFLTQYLPIRFLDASRFLTMLVGFALVITSVNIYRGKRRAFGFALALAFLSIVFHLAKSLDYEEGFFSLALVLVLVLTKDNFTVHSSTPNLHRGVFRFALALGAAFVYGAFGFWMLDKREFGIDFRIADSVQRTLLFLTFQGDASLIPHTRYARWFLNSLYLISGTSIGYAMFALFRPVNYLFRTHPREVEQAKTIVEAHGRTGLDFFKYGADKSFFFSPSGNGFVAYGVGGSYALALGDPVGPESEIEALIRDFRTMCRDNGWGVGFHHVPGEFWPIYERQGFKRLKIGDEAIVDSAGYALEGGEKKHFRYRLGKLERDGYHVACYEAPLTDAVIAQARTVSDDWLRIPGHRERGFSLGYFDEDYLRSTPLFCTLDRDEQIVAFMNLIPSYREGETTFDLMRHRAEAPKTIMDYLFVKFILHAKERGFRRVNLGMAAMSGFQEDETASIEERAIHYFVQRLNFLFRFSGLYRFKAKFATSWEPCYWIYEDALDLPRQVVALGRISEREGNGGGEPI